MNLSEINASLSAVIQGLQDHSFDVKTAEATSNAVGKLVSAQRGQLEYYNDRKIDTPAIDFWEK